MPNKESANNENIIKLNVPKPITPHPAAPTGINPAAPKPMAPKPISPSTGVVPEALKPMPASPQAPKPIQVNQQEKNENNSCVNNVNTQQSMGEEKKEEMVWWQYIVGLLFWVVIGYGVYHFFFASKPTEEPIKPPSQTTKVETKKAAPNINATKPTSSYKASSNEVFFFKGENGVEHYAEIDSLEFSAQGEITAYVRMVLNGKMVDGKSFIFSKASGKAYRLNLGRGTDDLGDYTKNSYTKGLYNAILPYSKYTKWVYVDGNNRYRKLENNRSIVNLIKKDANETYIITFYGDYFIVDFVKADVEAKGQTLQKEVGIKQYYKDNPRITKIKQSMGI